MNLKNVPVIPLRDVVIFPKCSLTIQVGRGFSKKAINDALINNNSTILVVTQKDSLIKNPEVSDLHRVGSLCYIKILSARDEGVLEVLLTSSNDKYSIDEIHQSEEGYFVSDVSKIVDTSLQDIDMLRYDELLRACNNAAAICDKLSLTTFKKEILINLDLKDFISVFSTLNIYDSSQVKQDLLEMNSVNCLAKMIQYIVAYSKSNRELGGEMKRNSSPYEELKSKIEEKEFPEHVLEEATRQLERLKVIPIESSEHHTARTYIEWLLDCPWKEESKDCDDIKMAIDILENSHYGMSEVKDRMIEYLAVKKLINKVPPTILCLYGPPGVGKTTLARSIADSLDRSFVKIALGGVRDESEIRGHRRTYVGSMPGRVVQALKQAKTVNPVILLDEIDKVGADGSKGNVSASLLEVLDPDQNKEFRDNYINLEMDLSKIIFIATANDLSTIPAPLRDRMEIIEISSYTREEKFHIAKDHLISKVVEDAGLAYLKVNISDPAIYEIIDSYTREAGVRQLNRCFESIMRKIARKVVEEDSDKPVSVKPAMLSKFLGTKKYSHDSISEEHLVGVCNGLAWTSSGGDLLKVEAIKVPGKGSFKFTGHLGDVMKESVNTVFSVIRAKFPSNASFFEKSDIHVHFPAAATPKDGPSAGITIACCMYSVVTGREINKYVAMTGELSLTGKVLPIGGLKEKLIAAHRAGVKKVIIPLENERDLEKVPEEVMNSLDVIMVENIDDVFSEAIIG